MIKVQFLGLSPECIDGFTAIGKRTFEGALHLKPSSVYDISEEEFEHVKKIRPDLKFHVFASVGKVIKPKGKGKPVVSKETSSIKEDKKKK